jgi:rod shape-determining protein MreD
MIRLLLSALNPPAFVLLAIIAVGVQTSLFASYPLMYLQPDFLLIAVIWCAMKRSFTEGGILTLIFGNIAEIHSSSPAGILLIAYMAVYLAIRLTAKLFVIPSLAHLIIVTLGASIFWKCSYMTVLYMMGLSANQWRHAVILLFPGAVMEGVIGIWLYRWLDRFDWITYKNVKARQILEGELQLDSEDN